MTRSLAWIMETPTGCRAVWRAGTHRACRILGYSPVPSRQSVAYLTPQGGAQQGVSPCVAARLESRAKALL